MTRIQAARRAVQAIRAAERSCADFDPSAVSGPIIADIMQHARLQNYASACIDAGRLLPEVLEALEESQRREVRLLTAYRSARERAWSATSVLGDCEAERDALRDELRALRGDAS